MVSLNKRTVKGAPLTHEELDSNFQELADAIAAIAAADGAPGSNGADGADGASAYEVAVANGFVGNEAAWLASLVGPTGATGATGAAGATGNQGIQGIQGIQGVPGNDGADGAPGPSGSIDYFTSSLGSNVQLSTSNTFANGPSLTLPAGTWLINCHAHFQKTTTTASQVTARIRAGATTIASQNAYHASLSGITLAFAMTAVVVLADETTVTLQMATTVGSTVALMRASAANNGDGNNATQINAIRLA